MPFGINNPFPTSVASECKKSGKVSRLTDLRIMA